MAHYLAGHLNSNLNKELTKFISTRSVHDSVSVPLLSSFPERSEVREREFVLEFADPDHLTPPVELHLLDLYILVFKMRMKTHPPWDDCRN